jgi:hypothetical protein
MKNQLFKSLIGSTLLWDFLNNNGEYHGDYYIFSKPLYKKACFNDTITPFVNIVKEYYYESKKHYTTRKMDYGKFITIIRQICNSLNIEYSTQLIYNNSTYEIVYTIYVGAGPENEILPVNE